MATDKPEKGSGTRHQARECALQMLFAYDLAGPESFSAVDYWGQLGFEQFRKGANDLVWSFVTEADKLEKGIESLRVIVKQVDVLDKQSSRFDRLKQLDARMTGMRKAYREYVDAFVHGEPSGTEAVDEAILAFRELLANFETDLTTVISPRGDESSRIARDAKAAIRRMEKVLDNISGPVLSSVVDLVRNSNSARHFADELALGTIKNLEDIDTVIRTRAEHWRIERMALVDRNVLRLAVFEFLHQNDTPNTVAINEALELARRFSSFESTQFINGVLDGINQDREPGTASDREASKSQASS